MGTKADMHATDWVLRFNAGLDRPIVIHWSGKTAKDALDSFVAEVMQGEWYDLRVPGGVVRLRTSFIGAVEAMR